eukprot:SAG11_NODE_647_length_7957_cov_2.900903_9_plen_101_part_00
MVSRSSTWVLRYLKYQRVTVGVSGPRSREQERPKTQRSLLHRCHVTPSILVIPHLPPSQLRIKGSGASSASPGSELIGGAQREGSQQREEIECVLRDGAQ